MRQIQNCARYKSSFSGLTLHFLREFILRYFIDISAEIETIKLVIIGGEIRPHISHMHIVKQVCSTSEETICIEKYIRVSIDKNIGRYVLIH